MVAEGKSFLPKISATAILINLFISRTLVIPSFTYSSLKRFEDLSFVKAAESIRDFKHVIFNIEYYIMFKMPIK